MSARTPVLETTDGVETVRRELLVFRTPRPAVACRQVVVTLVLWAACWCLAWRSLGGAYPLTVLLAIPAALLVVRAFVLQHDCGHHSLSGNPALDDLIGRLLSMITLTPYACWRRYHAAHHAASGDLDRRGFGDVRTMTVREYRTASPWQRLLYRAYRHPLVLFGAGPFVLFVVRQRFAWYVPKSWTRERWSVRGTNLALLTVGFLAARAIGLRDFLAVETPICVFASSIGVWLFYVQHQFAGTWWGRRPEWNAGRAAVEGSSYYELPAPLRWVTADIGVHHVHHLDSRIPNYRLRECLRAIPALREVDRLTLSASFACASLKLWDEERGQMVGFPERAEEAS